MLQINQPYAQFTELDGSPLDGGYIYIGTAGQNPQTNEITVYWDEAATIIAAQPLRTIGGYIARNGSPARCYISAVDYSMTIRNNNQSIISSELYAASIVDSFINDIASASGTTLIGGTWFGGVVTTVSALATSIGATLIGWIQAGTGAIARSLSSKVRENISPEDFGTNTTPGTTDMTAAINAAIVYANSIGGGTVKTNLAQLITSPILMLSNVDLEINNTLTCSGMTAQGGTETTNSAVLFVGVSVLTSALTVSGTANGLTVTVASSTGITTGDMIIVEDDNYFGVATSTGVNSHLARVMGVVGNVITIDNPLPTAFPSATSQVRKVTLCENANVKVKTIAGAPYQGVAFKLARHCSAKDTESNAIGKNAIYFTSAFGCRATNIIGRNPNSAVSPYGYGCLFDFGASDNILENSYFEGIREISAGEYARRNIIRNNTIINAIDSAINTHGLSAEDTLILDNIIVYPAQYGIAIGQVATSGKGVDIRTVVRGNTIIDSVSYAIREAQYSPGTSIACDTIIENNVIKNGSTNSIYVGGAGVATDNTNTIVRNNKIMSSGGFGIFIDTVSVNNAVIDGNVIDGSASSGVIFNSTGENISLTNNKSINSGAYGYRNFAVGPRIIVSNNYAYNNTSGDYLNLGISTAPAVGTWQLGDIVPNVGGVASGANNSFICTTTGTLGTLNGGATTGGITINTKALVVNSATGLQIGQYITIAGVAGVKRITGLSGTSVTIDTNASATVAGAAVAFSNAVFKSTGTIA